MENELVNTSVQPTVSVESPGLPTFTVGLQDLQQDYDNFRTNAGIQLPDPADDQTRAKGLMRTKAALDVVGISDSQQDGYAPAGYDSKGKQVFANPALASSNDPKLGKGLTNQVAALMDRLGVFKDDPEAARRLEAQGNAVLDNQIYESLNTARKTGSYSDFANTMSKVFNISDSEDLAYTNYKVYENWPMLSQGQKSLALATIGSQGLKDSNGERIANKSITPDVPGAPSMTVAEGMQLQGQGINAGAAVNNWRQYADLQESIYKADTATEVVMTGDDNKALGYGRAGREVNLPRGVFDSMQASPQPQFGVGAISIPYTSNVPDGYNIVHKDDRGKVIIPANNEGTSVIGNMATAYPAAKEIHSKWNPADAKGQRGADGGSALTGALSGMSKTNPHSLSSIALAGVIKGSDKDSLQLISDLVGQAGAVAITGKATSDQSGMVTDGKQFSRNNHDEMMKAYRAQMSSQGIPSAEVGYYLLNQAWAEGRITESQLVASQRAMDMTFNPNSYNLAQRMLLGKSKANEIYYSRQVNMVPQFSGEQ